MSRSPPIPHPSIVNVGNLLPSFSVLDEEVAQRQRDSHPSSHGHRLPSAWSGFPRPDTNLLPYSSANSRPPLPAPLQLGRPSAPQINLPPRLLTFTTVEPSKPRKKARARAPPPSTEVVPQRMGGRYAQTPRHSNGQPHAPGLMLGVPQQSQPDSVREWVASSVQAARHSHIPIVFEDGIPDNLRGLSTQDRLGYIMRTVMASQGNPTCPHCQMDLQIEARRQWILTLGSDFVPFPHESRQRTTIPLPVKRGIALLQFQSPPNGNGERVPGVSMAEILDFRDCLFDARGLILVDTLEKVQLVLEAKGYPTVTKQIAGNCPHRAISRFNFAYCVCAAYQTYLKDYPFDPTGLTQNDIVVRSINHLRLEYLYSYDHTNWMAHFVYVF